MEHRWGRRQPMDVPVRFVALPAIIGTGRVLNMSTTGAYMETTVPLRRLAVLFIEPAAAPGGEGRVRRIAASVVRHDSRGVGLEWCDSAVERSAGYRRLNRMSAAAAALAASAAPAESAAASPAATVAAVAPEQPQLPESSDPATGYELEFLD